MYKRAGDRRVAFSDPSDNLFKTVDVEEEKKTGCKYRSDSECGRLF